METKVTEIGQDIFRISSFLPGTPVSFGCFVIRDDAPAMIETGLLGLFNDVHDAVRRLIDPAKLRYLIVPHFEMDECGSLNRFLAIAPNAEAVSSSLGARVTLHDFSDRPPKAMSHNSSLALGRKKLRMVSTPWVHFWDSMLVYNETDRILFTSDLFMQPGDREPMTDEDRSAEVVQFCRFSGLLPSQKHLETALSRIEPLAVDTLACHHGSVLRGDPARYYRALRENTVGDIVGAPFYEMQQNSGAK